MDKKRDGIKEINKICKSVLKITDEDFEQAQGMAQEQSNYVHPLKYATAHKYHKLGDHNIQIINALRALRETIKQGANG